MAGSLTAAQIIGLRSSEVGIVGAVEEVEEAVAVAVAVAAASASSFHSLFPWPWPGSRGPP